MKELLKFKIINQLKSVYRANKVPGRKESSAEHTWSCLLLADYFMLKASYQLDKARVYELITYHDLVEIEAGDTELSPHNENLDKSKKELAAAKKLKKALPKYIDEKFWNCFLEFEKQETIESKFVKAIDVLDPIIQQLTCEAKWDGWTTEGRDWLIRKKAKYFEYFPEIRKDFDKLLDFLEENKYFER